MMLAAFEARAQPKSIFFLKSAVSESMNIEESMHNFDAILRLVQTHSRGFSEMDEDDMEFGLFQKDWALVYMLVSCSDWMEELPFYLYAAIVDLLRGVMYRYFNMLSEPENVCRASQLCCET